ncbi:MAG: hypothetical protein Altm2KO_02840 [Alteromonas macleodii]
MSIFDKINAGHQDESEQLRDAQQVLQSAVPTAEKQARIEALMHKAPEYEKAMFGDLLSNLVLRAD